MDAVKPREDLVDVAVKFLANPRVKSSPLEYKKQFLRKKDLTDEEISLAIEKSGAESHETEAANQTVALTSAPPPVPERAAGGWGGWRLYVSVTATLVAVVIALYRLVQNYIVPFLAAREEERRVLKSIQEDVRELREKMTATVTEVQQSVAGLRAIPAAAEQGQYEKLQEQQKMTELKAEVASLKGLLLGREQFAPPPALNPGIPAWQKKPPPPETTNETPATESPDSSSANETAAAVSSGDCLTNGTAEAVTRDGETTNRDEGETEGQQEDEEVTPASADVEASDDVTLKHVVTTALMGDSPEGSLGDSPPPVDVSEEIPPHVAVEEIPTS